MTICLSLQFVWRFEIFCASSCQILYYLIEELNLSIIFMLNGYTLFIRGLSYPLYDCCYIDSSQDMMCALTLLDKTLLIDVSSRQANTDTTLSCWAILLWLDFVIWNEDRFSLVWPEFLVTTNKVHTQNTLILSTISTYFECQIWRIKRTDASVLLNWEKIFGTKM